MKKLNLFFSMIFVFMSGCQILSSDKVSSPGIIIEPSSILAGQEFAITISSTREFIMPFCGGITYEIEKLDSENWIVFDGQYGPCNAMMKPETSISKSVTITYAINEEGVYRFVSAFKFDPDDEMKPLYSGQFEVESEY